MAEALLNSGAAHSIGWALVHFTWQGTLAALVTAAMLSALRRFSPQARYIVACTGLLVVVALPVVTARRHTHDQDVATIRQTDRSAATITIAARRSADEALKFASAAPPNPQVSNTPSRRQINIEAWLPTVLILWLSGIVALSLRLATGCIAIERLRRVGNRAAPEPWRIRVAGMAARLGVRRSLRLLESVCVEVPTVIGWLRPVILLPASALTGLSTAHLEALIAHEVAHVRRHDYLVNALQTLAETLLFYHPAVWWISSRIRVEREHCCDDLALDLCQDRLTYATALAQMEELRGSRTLLALAAADGPLLARIRRLLEPPASHDRRAPLLLVLTAVAVISAFTLATAIVGAPEDRMGALAEMRRIPVAAPAPPTPGPPPAQHERPAEIDHEERLSWSGMSGRFELRHRGTISLSDDDRDIIRISPGGYFVLSKTGWLSTEHVELRGNTDGSISRRFWSGSKELPYEPDGKAWLSDLLPTISRRSGFGAEQRVERILKDQGMPGVLREISRLQTDSVRARYFSTLFKSGILGGPQLAEALHQAADQISSSFELARALTLVPGRALANHEVRSAFFDAAKSISSDSELAQLLMTVAERQPIDSALRDAYFDALGAIDSSLEYGRVLLKLAERTSDPMWLTALVRATRGMTSDSEAAHVLTAVATRHHLEGPVLEAYLDSVSHISSKLERSRALAALGRKEVGR